jgi:hypothetical protein
MQRPAFPPGAEIWAWDWGVATVNGLQVLTKGGDLASYKTNMALFPQDKMGFVVLINANDRLGPILGDLRVAGLSIGLANLMLGQQPPDLASNLPVVFRLFVILVALVQAAGIFWSVITFRRWRRQPETRPHGPWGQVRYIGIPLILNLVWGLILLTGVPKILGGYPLSFLLYVTPELGYFLIVSGGVALVWGLLRTGLAYLALRGAKQIKWVPAT